ncbi:MAG: cytochrome c-type bioproteinis protein ccmC, partial [Marinobacter sp. T13-3]
VLVLVGVVNIPIIKYSVEWWNTLHQPATLKLTEEPSMPTEMLVPLLLSIAGLYLLFGWLACLRMKTEILVREQRTRWVKDMIMAGGR